MTAATETIENQNVVASTGIDQELDLETLTKNIPRADFNPDNFPRLVYRTEKPRATADEWLSVGIDEIDYYVPYRTILICR